MTPDFDLIDGVRVCRLRPSMLPSNLDRRGWGRIGVVCLALSLVLAASYFTIKSIILGQGWPSLLFAGLLATAFLLTSILALVHAFREFRLQTMVFPEPVQRIGEMLRSRATQNATLSRVCASFDGPAVIAYGWLWFDGAWVRFRGDRFDFDLTREQARLRIAGSEVVTNVTLPAKMGQHQLRIDTEWQRNRLLNERLGPALRTYEEAVIKPDMLLLPAVRQEAAEVPLFRTAAWCILSGAPLPAINAMATDLIPGSSAIDPTFIFFSFLSGASVPWLMIQLPKWSAQKRNAKLDRAIVASEPRS